MAVLQFNSSVGAGAIYQPLSGWQYEYVPFGGSIEILIDAAAVGVVATITSGSDTLMERSPLSAGGTAGVMPSVLNLPIVRDLVAAGDRIKINVENTTGGAVNVQGFINYLPG